MHDNRTKEPHMTRKDYVAIAAALKDAATTEFQAQFPVSADMMRLEIIGRIAGVFAQDNPRFDRARFLKACGVHS